VSAVRKRFSDGVSEQLAHIKSQLAVSRESLFHSARAITDSLETLHAFSRDVDQAVCGIYRRCIDEETIDRGYCLVALGGYGRNEVWPFSDIDILILHQNRHDSEKLSAAVRDFWNIGMSMGCVVRTVSECRDILGEDIATDTALLESRYLCGNRDLYDFLQASGIRPYFEKNKKEYISEMSAALRNGLYSSENSLYRVEPDLKNGICTLRDCQRLLWAERVQHETAGFAQLHVKSGFSSAEMKRLETGYAFLAGLRSALHIAAGQRLDILEMQYQDVIAGRYDFGQRGAGHLLETFFKTVRQIRLSLLSFLEKDPSGKNIWHDVRRRLSSVDIEPGIALLDGIIFSRNQKALHWDRPESILRIFRHSTTCQATLSVELRNKIRHRLDAMNPDDFRTKVAGDIFLSILGWPDKVGQVLLSMHEAGLLAKLIPPFSDLTCKVEYDQYHEFTVDQHSLLAVCACDELVQDPDDKIRGIYAGIKDKLILRLTVLLHDIGKAGSGDHAHNGAIIAEEAGERLGLADDQIARLRFLIYHHLDMSNLSLLRDFDDYNLSQFAAEVSNIETLNHLYLLTIVDIRSVGHNTWTGWKAYQLEQLYDRVYRILTRMKDESKNALILPASTVSDHPYIDDLLPEERVNYREWLAGADEDGLHLHQTVFAGFERLTVCAADRVGFLSDFIGCITSEGYNILSAKIYSTPEGKVLDIFHLEPPEKPRLSPQKRLDNLHQKWQMINCGRAHADGLVRDRIKKYPPPVLRLANAKPALDVHVNNEDSMTATIVEIDTVDNFGLLHKIARCFHENDVNIVAAKLSTRNDQACDVFYVTDAQKNKFTNNVTIHFLLERLLKRLSSEIDEASPRRQ
jgi:[protein-PII] uridylyltransferase